MIWLAPAESDKVYDWFSRKPITFLCYKMATAKSPSAGWLNFENVIGFPENPSQFPRKKLNQSN
jgi:hypothetical protein